MNNEENKEFYGVALHFSQIASFPLSSTLRKLQKIMYVDQVMLSSVGQPLCLSPLPLDVV